MVNFGGPLGADAFGQHGRGRTQQQRSPVPRCSPADQILLSHPESSDFPRFPTHLYFNSPQKKPGRDMADDMDVMAMMGITGFGKQTKKRELDPKRFEKNRREGVRVAHAIARSMLISWMLSRSNPPLPHRLQSPGHLTPRWKLATSERTASMRTTPRKHGRSVARPSTMANPNSNP